MKTEVTIRIILMAVLTICFAGTLQAEDWDMYITVDNQYDIYFGTSTTTNFYAGGDNDWFGVELVQATGRLPSDYLYVATASDHNVAQGFLGTFTNTTTNATISTGDTVWEVFPAGAYSATNPYGPGLWPANLMPTQPQVDTAIAYAEANGLWVAPTEVLGYDNDNSTPIAPYTWEWGWYFANIQPSASWIWYDSGNDPGIPGFRPAPVNGFNHDEFLVFRVAGIAPEPATLAILTLGLVAGLARRRR